MSDAGGLGFESHTGQLTDKSFPSQRNKHNKTNPFQVSGGVGILQSRASGLQSTTQGIPSGPKWLLRIKTKHDRKRVPSAVYSKLLARCRQDTALNTKQISGSTSRALVHSGSPWGAHFFGAVSNHSLFIIWGLFVSSALLETAGTKEMSCFSARLRRARKRLGSLWMPNTFLGDGISDYPHVRFSSHF